MATRDERLRIRLEVDGDGRVRASLANVAGEMRRVRGEVTGIGGAGAGGGAGAFQAIVTGSDRARSAISSLRNVAITLGPVFAGVGVVSAIRQYASLADTSNLLAARVRLVTSSQSEQAAVQERLFAISQQTGTALEGTTTLYTRLARSTRDLNLPQTSLLRIVETLNKAMVVSGVSASESAAGLQQLSQGLAKGRLDGDELRSVLENIPPVADAIAREFGVTVGALRDLGAAGELVAPRVLRAIQSISAETDRSFALIPVTVSRAFQTLQNDILAAVGELDRANGGTQALVGSIQSLAAAVRDPSFREFVDGFLSKVAGGLNLAQGAGQAAGRADLGSLGTIAGVAGIAFAASRLGVFRAAAAEAAEEVVRLGAHGEELVTTVTRVGSLGGFLTPITVGAVALTPILFRAKTLAIEFATGLDKARAEAQRAEDRFNSLGKALQELNKAGGGQKTAFAGLTPEQELLSLQDRLKGLAKAGAGEDVLGPLAARARELKDAIAAAAGEAQKASPLFQPIIAAAAAAPIVRDGTRFTNVPLARPAAARPALVGPPRPPGTGTLTAAAESPSGLRGFLAELQRVPAETDGAKAAIKAAGDALAALDQNARQADGALAIFGPGVKGVTDEATLLTNRTAALQRVLQLLLAAGVNPANAGMQALGAEIRDLQTTAEKPLSPLQLILDKSRFNDALGDVRSSLADLTAGRINRVVVEADITKAEATLAKWRKDLAETKDEAEKQRIQLKIDAGTKELAEMKAGLNAAEEAGKRAAAAVTSIGAAARSAAQAVRDDLAKSFDAAMKGNFQNTGVTTIGEAAGGAELLQQAQDFTRQVRGAVEEGSVDQLRGLQSALQAFLANYQDGLRLVGDKATQQAVRTFQSLEQQVARLLSGLGGAGGFSDFQTIAAANPLGIPGAAPVEPLALSSQTGRFNASIRDELRSKAGAYTAGATFSPIAGGGHALIAKEDIADWTRQQMEGNDIARQQLEATDGMARALESGSYAADMTKQARRQQFLSGATR